MRSLLLLSLLAGCATTYPEYPVTADPNITFKRNPGFAGWNCKTVISINNYPKAVIGIGDILEFTMPPGRHLLKATAASGTCANFEATRIVVLKIPQTLQIQVIKE